MSKFFDPLSVSGIKRLLLQVLFLLKWFGLLSSATMEMYLHQNFGRRYTVSLFGATVLFAICASFAPSPSDLSNAFGIGLVVLALYHAVCAFHLGRLGPPAHSFSTGEPWPFWRASGFKLGTIQRYFEPALCFFVSYPIGHFDGFLGGWFKAGAVSLFVKQHLELIKLARRVLDSLDAKHDAQVLNAALKPYHQPTAPAAQRPHRVHMAGRAQRKNP